MNIPFNNSYINLPDHFYTKLAPSTVKDPQLIIFNKALAKTLNITESSNKPEMAQIFSGNKLLHGAEPLATVYAGHQFGGFSHQLGDGRAILLGELIGLDKIRYDIQLKGSGRTPYSRGGDGRSALGPVIREYLLSEAMHRLGVPTTRALAAVTTGEDVARNTLVPGGIITRVAKGFVRVGSFEYFSAKGDISALKQLADYVIRRHYFYIAEMPNPYQSLLLEVINSQAKLIAQWMSIGFIHGVMNTDNMSIMGETIDYGPCAFMDHFSHNRVYSSIDHNRRYAYNKQAEMAQWNLIRFAETLLPLFIDVDKPNQTQIEEAVEIAKALLETFQDKYQTHYLSNMRNKIGLYQEQQEDQALIEELLDCMQQNQADFTLTFYYLSQLADDNTSDKSIRGLFSQPKQFDAWAIKWRRRLSQEKLTASQRQAKMNAINPLYIPRNHQVEAAIRAAEDQNDFSVFHALHDVLQNPFKQQSGKQNYSLAPRPEEIVQQTFCGT